jgi:hypothetical protein
MVAGDECQQVFSKGLLLDFACQLFEELLSFQPNSLDYCCDLGFQIASGRTTISLDFARLMGLLA